jgi:predicted phage terminase large subunit-like protein
MSRKDKEELLELLKEQERRDFAKQLDCSKMTREEANETYREVLASGNIHAERKLCQTDLFYLLTIGFKRKDIDHPWLYDRCREVEASPDGHLDLWARDHYKSTIITYGKTIQDILNDPEITVGIFSHTRPIAKAFLEQIKREFETNEYLQDLFPEILYKRPQSEASKWSLDSGIIVKRKTNPKEATVEAWGLVDGQPTSRHFSHQIYDDVVTLESVSTPDQISKTTKAWEMSMNLGSGDRTKRRYIGTRYHLKDSYSEMIARGSVQARVKPATHNGKAPPEGHGVFLSDELLMKKRRDQGPYTFGTQQLQDPVADKSMSFKSDWLKYYDSLGDTSKWNKYLIADPASKKKSTSDFTVMMVIGLAPDNNYYLIDGFRDRLNLTQRAARVFKLHREHSPKAVGYEEYGMQADKEHIEYEMEQKNYRFDITTLGGSLAKEDRIKKLIPIYEQKRFYLPKSLHYVDYEGNTRDFIQLFISNEFTAFPVTTHDDMLDCMARILDPVLGAEFPRVSTPKPTQSYQNSFGGNGWMG